MDTRFATSPDSTRIAFDVSGAGTLILLLHGGGSSRLDWHETGHVVLLQTGPCYPLHSSCLFSLRGFTTTP